MKQQLLFLFSLIVAILSWCWICMKLTKISPVIEKKVNAKGCIESYISILQQINQCGTTTGLSEFFDAADDFYSQYQNKMGAVDLTEYYENILETIRERRFSLMMERKLMVS